MRAYGRQGMAAILRRHIEDAREFQRWVEADPRFEIVASVLFSLVCFRLKGADQRNRLLLDEINRSGAAFLAGTVLDGRFVLRLAIGHHRTTRDDLRLVWDKIRQLAG
jgi:aromatic-L-amino-acid decarboxylase